IDGVLRPGGIVTGAVTDAATGAPLGGICVTVGDGDGLGQTKKDGTYRIDQLTPGREAIGFGGGCGSSRSFAPQWYKAQDNSAAADPVTITSGAVTAGIDAALRPGATITGHVTARDGRPLSQVCVGVAPPNFGDPFGGLFFPADTASSHGTYQ